MTDTHLSAQPPRPNSLMAMRPERSTERTRPACTRATSLATSDWNGLVEIVAV